MKKIVQRLLIFFITLPLIFALVAFLPQRNHLALNLVILIFIGLGAAEFSVILGSKGLLPGRVCPVPPAGLRGVPLRRQAEAAMLGILAPLAVVVVNGFLPDPGGPNTSTLVFSAIFILEGIWLLFSRVFTSEAGLHDYVLHVVSGFSVMVYPGIFLVWFIQMGSLANSSPVILTFLLMVFGSDSAAWAAGMLFGKGNRGIVAASPNKSVAGFIGGIGTSILVGAGAEFFIKDVFLSRFLPPLAGGIILGLLSGCASSLGDLAESALKRSSGMKDSGTLIPGRGGVLDSIDSIALAAPVFYLGYRILFQ
jgi:phosphatidate cytidylyltransferase